MGAREYVPFRNQKPGTNDQVICADDPHNGCFELIGHSVSRKPLVLVLAADFLLLTLPGQRHFEIRLSVCRGEERSCLCTEFDPELKPDLIRGDAQIP